MSDTPSMVNEFLAVGVLHNMHVGGESLLAFSSSRPAKPETLYIEIANSNITPGTEISAERLAGFTFTKEYIKQRSINGSAIAVDGVTVDHTYEESDEALTSTLFLDKHPRKKSVEAVLRACKTTLSRNQQMAEQITTLHGETSGELMTGVHHLGLCSVLASLRPDLNVSSVLVVPDELQRIIILQLHSLELLSNDSLDPEKMYAEKIIEQAVFNAYFASNGIKSIVLGPMDFDRNSAVYDVTQEKIAAVQELIFTRKIHRKKYERLFEKILTILNEHS